MVGVAIFVEYYIIPVKRGRHLTPYDFHFLQPFSEAGASPPAFLCHGTRCVTVVAHAFRLVGAVVHVRQEKGALLVGRYVFG